MEPLIGVFFTIILPIIVVLNWSRIKIARELKVTKVELSLSNEAMKKTQEKLDASLLSYSNSVRGFESKIQTLSQYQKIADIDAEIATSRAKAESHLASILLEADKTRQNVLDVSNELKAEASKKAQEIKQQALDYSIKLRSQVDSDALRIAKDANGAAEKIISEAKEKYQEAFQLNERKNLLEKAIAGLKNKFDGYGNQFVIPTHSLLDDLAEEFGFAEAGIELKKARETTKNLILERRAATCDYVQADRSDAATDFTTDAFNGKVDSILSRVKHDNIGILKQKILDAFALVNQLGRGFRNAQITPTYLNARLQELKWAVIAQELKYRAQEEQKAIRDQIRDEERAKKEYEKAMKEAEKEESLIKKAIDKIRAQTEAASDEQRSVFEGKLLELTEKLRIAEEKNHRAQSMAELTKSGYVYIISNEGSFGQGVVKIGLTRRLEPMDRIKELGDASVPFGFDVHAMIYSDNAPSLEKSLQAHFIAGQMNKVNPRKEFFKTTVTHIKGEIEKLGYKVNWTLAAAAQEYRETIALEKAFKDDPAQYEAWLSRQAKAMRERIWDTGSDEDDDVVGEEVQVKKTRSRKSA